MQARSRSLQLNSISNTRVTREWYLHGGCSSPPPPSGLRTARSGAAGETAQACLQDWLRSRPHKAWALRHMNAWPTLDIASRTQRSPARPPPRSSKGKASSPQGRPTAPPRSGPCLYQTEGSQLCSATQTDLAPAAGTPPPRAPPPPAPCPAGCRGRRPPGCPAPAHAAAWMCGAGRGLARAWVSAGAPRAARLCSSSSSGGGGGGDASSGEGWTRGPGGLTQTLCAASALAAASSYSLRTASQTGRDKVRVSVWDSAQR